MAERYKVIENKQTKEWEIYSVWGELKGSFKSETEAKEFKALLERNYRITQYKLGRIYGERDV